MQRSPRGRPRRTVVALLVILLGVLVAVPSALAQTERDHGRHVQHFFVLSTDPDATKLALVANGPIHAKGTDVPVTEDKDVFKFPDGNLTIKHQAAEEGETTVDEFTCLATYTERGTYRVTKGTRAYKEAHGHGHYRVKVTTIGCDEEEPEVFTLEIRASGPLYY